MSAKTAKTTVNKKDTKSKDEVKSKEEVKPKEEVKDKTTVKKETSKTDVKDNSKTDSKTESKTDSKQKTESKPKTESKKKETKVEKAVEPKKEEPKKEEPKKEEAEEVEEETEEVDESGKKKKRTVYKPEDYDMIIEKFDNHIKESFELKHAFQDIFKKFNSLNRQINGIYEKKKERSNNIKKNARGILQPCIPSPELAKFLKLADNELIPQTEVVSRISKYIKEHNLSGKKVTKKIVKKDKEGNSIEEEKEVINNSYINLEKDPEMMKLFPDCKGQNLQYINLSSMVSKHLTRPAKEESTTN